MILLSSVFAMPTSVSAEQSGPLETVIEFRKKFLDQDPGEQGRD